MAYGTVKVDTIIFDQGGTDQNATVSGIYRAITSGVTVSGTISGAVLVGTTTVSGTTVTGTTANFVSGVFTTVVSGATVTGTQSSFTSGNFVTLSGATATFTSGVIASGTAAAPSLSILGDPNTGIYSPGADQLAVATSGTRRLDVNSSGQFRIGDGGTVGIFSAQAVANGNLHIRDIASVIGSGTGVALDVLNDAGSAVQDLAIRGTNTIFRNSAGETLRITSAGNVGIGITSPSAKAEIVSSGSESTLILRNASATNSTYSELKFAPFTGTTAAAAAIRAEYYTNNDSTLAFRTTATNAEPTTKLFIDNTGRVGIGTTSPGYQLQVVVGAGAQNIFLVGQTGISNGYTITSNGTALTHAWFSSAGESARIDSSGRLLVGTSTSVTGTNQPQYAKLQVVGNTLSGARSGLIALGRSAAASTIVAGDQLGGITFGDNAAGEFAYIFGEADGTAGTNDYPGRLVFSTTADGASSPTERMRITSQGNVLIGSTVDSIGRFGVAADTNAAPGNRVALFTSTYTGGDSSYEGIGIVKNANDNSTSNVFQMFYINAGVTICGRINANGAGAAAFGSTSDARLKENIKDIEPQLVNICSLRPVEFDYIEAEGGGHQIGFIAQEIENIYPDSISERDDGMKMLTGWSKTEARLVKALQEAVAKIETLEARLTAAGIE